jgi:hypothetical protein
MWQVLNATDSATEKLKWWTYSQEFIYECCEPEGDFIHGSCTSTDWGEACSYAVMDDVGIDSSLVDQCVLESWNDDGTNSVLEAEMTRAYEHSVDRTGLPTMYINTAPYRGTLTCEQPLSAYTCGALEAICAGYEAGTEPDACTGDIGCGLGEHTDACGMCGGDGAYDKCGICMSQSNPDFGTYCESSFDPTAIIIVAVVLAFLIPAWIWYYRKQQEQQRRNIDDILRSYLPLEDANEIAGHDTEDASFISRNNNNIAVHSDDVELVQPSNLTIA